MPLLELLHASPVQLVLEFTGAGSAALAWLHSLGGSSRTVLESSDRYSHRSLSDLLGYRPAQFTSLSTSADMAARALERARFLAEPSVPVIGIGASATIATDRLKKGDHRTAVVLRGPLGSHCLELTMEKGQRDRAGEEELVSRLILSAIADGSGLLQRPDLRLLPGEELTESFEPVPLLAALLAGETDSLELLPDGSLTEPRDRGPRLVLSGSFNPLHYGHTGLAAAASGLLGREVSFELPVINAEKPPLQAAELQRRAQQFAGRGPLLLTRAPLFIDKVRLFPGSTFIIGADTAVRLLDARFYGSEQAVHDSFRELDSLGGHFLVAGRSRDGGFAHLDALNIPAQLQHLFSSVPEDVFRADISSTELRARGL